MALIVLREVSKDYITGGVAHRALRNADLSVAAGEFVGVVGPSGSGKSTLLNLMAAIDSPSAGEVLVDGVDIGTFDEDQAAHWRGHRVGVVFQFFQLLPTMTLADNVMLPMDFCKVHPPRRRPAIALDLLERVGLADHADKLPSEVSGGEQQRAAIARALANDPPIILADEPTGNLDSAAAEGVMGLFAALAERDRTIVMVTHDRDLANRADRVVTLKDGLIVSVDTTAGSP